MTRTFFALACLCALAAAQGADADAFLAWSEAEGPGVLARLEETIRGRGVFGVPAFLIDDEVFLGRQHLPMIRWILHGRQGPGPI